MAFPGSPLRCDGVTPGGVSGVRFTFLATGVVAPDGPAAGEARFMNVMMLCCSFTFVADWMLSIDCLAHAFAFAGDIFLRRLRVIRDTIGSSSGSFECGMMRDDET